MYVHCTWKKYIFASILEEGGVCATLSLSCEYREIVSSRPSETCKGNTVVKEAMLKTIKRIGKDTCDVVS